MIVELPGSKKSYKMSFFHFSNNNLSIRKNCAEDLGGYDTKMEKSEDVDICIRVARHPGWVAFREPGNFVRHKARTTFLGFVKQLWGWGRYLGRPYAKTGVKGIYVYWVSSRDHKITLGFEVKRFPVLVCAFVSDFYAAHLSLAAGLILLSLGYPKSAAAGIAAAGFFMWRNSYDVRDSNLKPLRKLGVFCLHYAANVCYMTAAVLSGLMNGILLLPCPIFKPPPTPAPKT